MVGRNFQDGRDFGRILCKEEIKRSTRDSSSSMHDEENCALASNVKKGKEKGSLSESNSSNDGKKVDKSKV